MQNHQVSGDYMTVQEISTVLNATPRAVRAWIKRREIATTFDPLDERKILVHRDDFDAALNPNRSA